MRRVGGLGWHPLLFALGGTVVVLLLSMGAQAQTDSRVFQTVPTPTPPVIATPTQRAVGSPPPAPPQEIPSTRRTLALRKAVSPRDVLPGEELQSSLWITNTSAAAVTGIVVFDSIDPALHLLEISATQGAAEVNDRSILVNLGVLETGQTALVIVRTRVDLEARNGQVLLNQATVYYDGGQASSNVVAAGLPPIELPATGQSGRGP